MAASKTVAAYEVLKKDRIFLNQTRFSEPVRSIDENANAGTVRFVFEDNKDVTIALGDMVTVK